MKISQISQILHCKVVHISCQEGSINTGYNCRNNVTELLLNIKQCWSRDTVGSTLFMTHKKLLCSQDLGQGFGSCPEPSNPLSPSTFPFKKANKIYIHKNKYKSQQSNIDLFLFFKTLHLNTFTALLHHLEATGKQPELSCVKQLKNMIALIQGESTFMKGVSI